MKQLIKSWILGALVASVAAGAGALAFVGSETSAPPTLTISPEHVLTGKTIDAGEPFEMTLHVQGDPSTSYELVVTSEGTAGACPEAPATLTTNPQGKVVWECDFQTAEGAGEGTVTFAVSLDGGEPVTAAAHLTVRAPENEEELETTEEEEVVEDGEKADNHGQCVSYWTHRAKAEGLRGRLKGQFTSMVARSDCTGVDESEFADELEAALQQQAEAEATTSTKRGKPAKATSAKG